MNLGQPFKRAANRTAEQIARARGFEITKSPEGQPVINLLDTGKRHKVFKSGKVSTRPNIMASLGLDEIVEATKDIAMPKIQMMVRMMCMQAAQPQAVPVQSRQRHNQIQTKRR